MRSVNVTLDLDTKAFVSFFYSCHVLNVFNVFVLFFRMFLSQKYTRLFTTTVVQYDRRQTEKKKKRLSLTS